MRPRPRLVIDGRSVIGLVTARSGSKGLPGKNLKVLCGKSLIGWTLDAARASRYLDTTVVSTDDPGIADAARQHGGEVPFVRPAALASDEASSVDVVLHALDILADQGRTFDIVALLEPTSPLRETADIDAALERLVSANADALVSVCRASTQHPTFMYRMGGDATLDAYIENVKPGIRRQDVEPLFYLEGTIYISTTASLRERRSFCHAQTIGFEVAKWKAPEIDDATDFAIVEAVMQLQGSRQ